MSSFFNIPDSCKVNNTIFKKYFYENVSLSSSDKEIFIKNIEKIQWLYCLKPENFYIKQFKDAIRDYPEIEVIEVVLNEDKKLNRIAEIIMRTIPYPMVLLFEFNGKIQIWTAHQRINQKDSTKNTIDDFIYTEWLNLDNVLFKKLDISKMNLTNFYTLYSDIVDTISIYNAKGVTNKALTGEQSRELTAKIEEIENKIALLKVKRKKETQFNKIVEIGLEIKKLEKERSNILYE